MTETDDSSGSNPVRLDRTDRTDAAAGSESRSLRAYTPARVGLRSAGKSLATSELLDMSQCLAEARDAVHAALSTAALLPQIANRGLDALPLKSAARDRAEYLRRPDLGRRLSQSSRETLAVYPQAHPGSLILVLADGLSAIAVERHALSVLDALLPLLNANGGWQIGPVILVEQARVAIGDEIGQLLNAAITLVLIGERPGLSAPDSLGAYITWAPRPGRTDAERNCISNIRPQGLLYELAARKIESYLVQARHRKLTGVELKEQTLLLQE